MATHRNDREYVRRRDALKRKTRTNGLPCHLCHKPIDCSLPWKHPMSFTADHLTPVGVGGSMTGPLAPAHRSCNSRRQTTPIEQLKRVTTPRTSRQW